VIQQPHQPITQLPQQKALSKKARKELQQQQRQKIPTAAVTAIARDNTPTLSQLAEEEKLLEQAKTHSLEETKKWKSERDKEEHLLQEMLRKTQQEALEEKQREQEELRKAMELSQQQKEEEELEKALRMSAVETTQATETKTVQPTSSDDDEELQRALRLSMLDTSTSVASITSQQGLSGLSALNLEGDETNDNLQQGETVQDEITKTWALPWNYLTNNYAEYTLRENNSGMDGSMGNQTEQMMTNGYCNQGKQTGESWPTQPKEGNALPMTMGNEYLHQPLSQLPRTDQQSNFASIPAYHDSAMPPTPLLLRPSTEELPTGEQLIEAVLYNQRT
jgi:hypothetical protein